jgi:hypothetical protein
MTYSDACGSVGLVRHNALSEAVALPQSLLTIDPLQFQQLCAALLQRLYPDLRAVDGSGGDEGVDAWEPKSGTYFQFHAPKQRVQSRKFSTYLQQVIEHHPAKWVFITNQDFTRRQWRWFDGLKHGVPFRIEVWGATKLAEVLARNADLADYYLAPAKRRNVVAIGSQTAHHISNIAAERVTVNVQTPRTSIPKLQVSGVISNDARKLGYLKYLGHRFNDLKERQIGRSRMRYQLIWTEYRREVGYNVAETPADLFETGCRYLQTRIEGSKVGRIELAEGKRPYLTFQEFLRRYPESQKTRMSPQLEVYDEHGSTLYVETPIGASMPTRNYFELHLAIQNKGSQNSIIRKFDLHVAEIERKFENLEPTRRADIQTLTGPVRTQILSTLTQSFIVIPAHDVWNCIVAVELDALPIESPTVICTLSVTDENSVSAQRDFMFTVQR